MAVGAEAGRCRSRLHTRTALCYSTACFPHSGIFLKQLLALLSDCESHRPLGGPSSSPSLRTPLTYAEPTRPGVCVGPSPLHPAISSQPFPGFSLGHRAMGQTPTSVDSQVTIQVLHAMNCFEVATWGGERATENIALKHPDYF